MGPAAPASGPRAADLRCNDGARQPGMLTVTQTCSRFQVVQQISVCFSPVVCSTCLHQLVSKVSRRNLMRNKCQLISNKKKIMHLFVKIFQMRLLSSTEVPVL